MVIDNDVFDKYGNYKFPDYSNSQYTNNVSATGGAMMGMTIDKTISELEILKKNTFGYMSAHQAFITAIDTMRKYQKIQEIVKWNNAPSPYYKPDGQLFREICEVVEDGNDD